MRGRRTFSIAMTMAIVIAVAVSGTGVANAHCTGSIVDWKERGHDSGRGATVRGMQGEILSTDFNDPHQYSTLRAFIILSPQTGPLPDFAEVGWQKRESDSQRHVFKAWQNNGEYRVSRFFNYSPSVGGYPNFKVHDQDGNQYWSFAYNGNALGNELVSFNTGYSLSQSEVDCSVDSAWAEFRILENFSCVNCSYGAYQNLADFGGNHPDYRYCAVSNSRHYIRQAC